MSTKVYLAYDERMTLHKPIPSSAFSSSSSDSSDEEEELGLDEIPMENPNRIKAIYEKLIDLESLDGFLRFIEIECVPVRREVVELVHSPGHYDLMKKTANMSDEELREMTIPNDLYFCKDTFMAARLAAGGVVECVNAVTSPARRSSRAMAIVRPPGHHATQDEPMGFCYFNNVAVAAKYAVSTGRSKRCFILDWDIHHGNGIQDLTYKDPQIFYLSIHRASFGSRQRANWFYPGTGRPSEVGKGKGVGTNLNIAWNKSGMGDVEYEAAFSQVILPLLQSFKPDMILIACGLDAVQGDLLGDCGLTPGMYYRMTRSVLEAITPETPVVVALEGGYNIGKSAKCMENVALALLDEPVDFGARKSQWYLQRPKLVTQGNQGHQRRTHDTAIMAAAVKAIQRSEDALERKGGTCLCGCHFRCEHSLSLPPKKRKLFEIYEDSQI